MSQIIHLNTPGYGPTEKNCLPCSGVTGKVFSVSPCSSHRDLQNISRFKLQVLSLKCSSRNTFVVCNASSGSYRRNPDFSRQNRSGFSRNRNRQLEDKDGSDNLEETELFSKNGPTSSASGSPKFQATATPGPREKEIVELFRKVQAQLRERAAVKEQKVEEPQRQIKQNETVDSLLKLLRKHSVQQGKRNNSTDSSRDFIVDQPEPNGSLSLEKSPTFFRSNNNYVKKVEESESPSLSRPRSSFRRQSPVPQIKKLPVYPDEGTINSVSDTNLEGKQMGDDPELGGDSEPKLKFKTEPELELEPEPEAELESVFPNGDLFDELDDETSEANEDNDDDDDDDDQDTVDHRDLNEMRLTELRALAKSRGLKGFSKLKKLELVELLMERSI